MKPALAPAPSRTSTGGIPPCASVYGCRCWVKCCSSSCWAAGWAFADSSELKKEAAAQYLCSSLLLAGRSIISIRRSICGRSGVPFLQGRLLLQQVYHAAQADASVLVAAEAISNCAEIPAFSTKSFITNSAIGLRQIFI